MPVLLLILLLFAVASPAAAQCTVSATGVSFGTYDVFASSPLTSTGGITYFCAPPDRAIEIHLDTGGSGSFLARQMANGAERLVYNLYLDPAGTLIWGDGTGGTSIFTGSTGPPGPPAGRTFTIPVYGIVPPEQDVAAGVYTDAIVVTLWL